MKWIRKILHHYEYSKIDITKINKINKNDNILFIIRLDIIGDYVCSRDFLRLIKKSQKFKNYKIVLCVNSILKDIVLSWDKQYVDEIIWFNTKYFNKSRYKKSLYKRINKYNYKYLLNYMSIRNTYSEEVVKNTKAENVYGIKGEAINLTEQELNNYNKLYTILFDCTLNYLDASYEFAHCLTKEYYESKKMLLNLDGNILEKYSYLAKEKFCIIFPSASYAEKRMPFYKFIESAKFYHSKTNGKVIIIGSDDDNTIIDYNLIAEYPYIINCCGKYKLSELPYIFKFADLIVTNNTCAMWISRLVTKNIIVCDNVFGPQKEHLYVENYNNNLVYYGKNDEYFYYVYPRESVRACLENKDSSLLHSQSMENIDLNDIFYCINKLLLI